MTARDTLEADLLIVGGGPAGLATAIHFRRLLARLRAQTPGVPDFSVLLLEKGAALGAHVMSGAAMDAAVLAELVPEGSAAGAPPLVPCQASSHEIFTARRSLRLPWVPPLLRNDGLALVRLGALVKWMGAEAEALGVEIATGFAGVSPLLESGRVVGVRTGDRGRDRAGQPKPGFSLGADVRAPLTVLAEGAHGSLTRQVASALGLDKGRQPAVYALGFKEVWEIPAGRLAGGASLHTLGYPLRGDVFGGGFVYSHSAREVSVGLVASLDYRDPRLDPFALFQELKLHPRIRGLLEGGRPLAFGARTLDEGGWHALPQPYADGLLLVGEAAGYLDTLRLKGIHLAIRSGMLAADTALEALVGANVTATSLSAYERRVRASEVGVALRRCRNLRAGFRWGRLAGLANAVLPTLTGGRGPEGPLARGGRAPGMGKLAEIGPRASGPARRQELPASPLISDRATAVFRAGTQAEEDQPSHLHVKDTAVCLTRCGSEYGQPCERFCPADVYEIVRAADGRPTGLNIHAANCLHCKTCEIADPYGIIEWVPPEGGSGPRYEGL
jgi:electron-transferring-flavoprotein dehydrogenase